MKAEGREIKKNLETKYPKAREQKNIHIHMADRAVISKGVREGFVITR